MVMKIFKWNTENRLSLICERVHVASAVSSRRVLAPFEWELSMAVEELSLFFSLLLSKHKYSNDGRRMEFYY